MKGLVDLLATQNRTFTKEQQVQAINMVGCLASMATTVSEVAAQEIEGETNDPNLAYTASLLIELISELNVQLSFQVNE